MNGFASHGLDEAAFGDKGGFSSGLKTFDAFRKLSSYFVAFFIAKLYIALATPLALRCTGQLVYSP